MSFSLGILWYQWRQWRKENSALRKKEKKNPDSTFDLFLFLNCSPPMSKVRLSFKITSLCGTNASNLITKIGQIYWSLKRRNFDKHDTHKMKNKIFSLISYWRKTLLFFNTFWYIWYLEYCWLYIVERLSTFVRKICPFNKNSDYWQFTKRIYAVSNQVYCKLCLKSFDVI